MSDETRELLVKVSATTELLRSNLIAAEREIAKFQTTTDVVTQRVERNFKQVGASSGQLKSGMQQLSYQLNDVATMFSLGAKPQQIFASQMGQVIQSVQLMTGGTSKLATFLGGPWGLAIGSAAVALTPFIAKLFDAKNAADQMGDAAAEAMAKLNASLVSGQSLTGQAADAATKRLLLNMGALAKANRDLQMAQSPDSARSAEDAQNAAANIAFIQRRRDSAQREINAAREQLNQVRSATQVQSMQAAAQTRLNAARAGGAVSRASGGGRAARGAGGRATTADNDPITPEIRFRAEMAKITNQIGQDLAKVRDKEYEDQIELINRKADYEFEARRDVAERLRNIEEQQMQYLAGIYERVFSKGTGAVWDEFENIGRQVIARVLAQFTLSRFNGGGFDLGSAVSGAFKSIFGGAYADGGRPPVGRISMVGERGPELFVPDVAGTIIPNHALSGGAPVFNVYMPNANADTVMMVRREIANAAPALVAAASGNTVRALNRKSL